MIRLFDFILSLFGLIILSPVLIFVSIWILLDSRGSVLYKQKRVGKDGIDFIVYKFRSMFINSEKKGLITISNNESRITRAGHFLRKYKLDELPQLFNVLIGNMSFVGPRPEVRKYVDLYNDDQLKILIVRPGITDLASIKFSNENKFLESYEDPEKAYIDIIMKEKIELNLYFINNYNLKTYFRIIMLTLLKIVKNEN